VSIGDACKDRKTCKTKKNGCAVDQAIDGFLLSIVLFHPGKGIFRLFG